MAASNTNAHVGGVERRGPPRYVDEGAIWMSGGCLQQSVHIWLDPG
jgi:hypothetical protein